MKRKITKAAYDALSDEIKKLYKLSGDDALLDLEDDDGEENAAKLVLERKHRKEAERKAKEAQDALDALANDDNKKKGDVAAVEASWQKKYDKLAADKTASDDKYKNTVLKASKDGVARDLAGKLTATPNVLMPHLLSRLDVDFEGDEPKTIVLDANGKRSAMTVAELEKEFRDNKDFAGIVTASKATGGSATKAGPTNTGGSAPAAGTAPPGSTAPLYSAMSPKQLAAEMASKVEASVAKRAAA